jgi:hypothetical protein
VHGIGRIIVFALLALIFIKALDIDVNQMVTNGFAFLNGVTNK